MAPTEEHPRHTPRLYENDWLTVLATLVVFLFHCARYFDHEGWHVKNPTTSDELSLFVGFVSQWIMPLFFLLSGVSSGFSLRQRSAGTYLADRAKRIALPFAFSTLVLSIPLQVWVERVSHGEFAGSFLAFYLQYFNGFYAFGGNFAWMGLHLWYLLALLLFSTLLLPLCLILRTASAQGLLSRLATILNFPGGVLLLALPLLASEYFVNMRLDGIGMRAFGGWSLLTYMVHFLLGFALSASPAFREGLKKSAYPALVLGLLATGYLASGPFHGVPEPHTADYAAYVALRTMHSWVWLTAIYGLGCRYLSAGTAHLRALRETALPFYVLHQTVIVCLGFALVPIVLPTLPKYLLLAAASFATTALLLLSIKRLAPLRPFFGLPYSLPGQTPR